MGGAGRAGCHVARQARGGSAVVARAFGICVSAPFLALLCAAPVQAVRIGSVRLSWIVWPVAVVVLGVVFSHAFRDTWPLGRDFLRTPVVEVADVVYTEHVASGGDDSPGYHFVGLDDGTSDVVTLWEVPTSTFRRLERGDRVELRRTPTRRGFRSMKPLAR